MKSTKLEWCLWIQIAFIIILFAAGFVAAYHGCSEIRERGLKDIVEELWEGSDEN